jgi:hypothetical protein
VNAQHAFLRDEGSRYDLALFQQSVMLTLSSTAAPCRDATIRSMVSAQVLHERSVRRERVSNERQYGRTDRNGVLIMTRSLDKGHVRYGTSERSDVPI